MNLCKSIFHAILHLADCKERFGPLAEVSQFWLERTIGWARDRLKARTKPGESMFLSIRCADAHKIVFQEPFFLADSDYEKVATLGGFELLGPKTIRNLHSEAEETSRIRTLLPKYFVRRYEGLRLSQARDIANEITEIRLLYRMRHI